jgi:AcrR family transcriptional regulator
MPKKRSRERRVAATATKRPPAPPEASEPAGWAEHEKQTRRKRRSREDVAARLCNAARQLFAERGFAATTTKEIALAADVSETLLFRYYGSKAVLFEEIISGPINRMMSEFAVRHRDERGRKDRDAVVRRYVTKLFEILSQNDELFKAAVSTPQQSDTHRGPRSHGLERYFSEAVTHLEMDYAREAHKLDFDPRIGARLAFGMIASAVLLRDWLFPQEKWSDTAITSALEHMIMRALAPRG